MPPLAFPALLAEQWRPTTSEGKAPRQSPTSWITTNHLHYVQRTSSGMHDTWIANWNEKKVFVDVIYL